MDTDNYKAAYKRQKIARQRAEDLIEQRSGELYDLNKELKSSYEQLKQQGTQLLHQEKLASLGQLSAGVAHEINNPAGFVKSNLGSLQQYIDDILSLLSLYQNLTENIIVSNTPLPEQASAYLEEINSKKEACDLEYLLEDIPSLINESVDGANRITKIVNGLKIFSRIDSDEKELFDVNACIENTIKLANNEIKFKAEVKLELQDIPNTMGFPGGISQVVLNLLINASQAIEEFGEITVRTYTTSENNKDWVIIQVEDNGSGIKPEKINNIFDPFFTTKEVGVGTGLGLSISQGILEQHDGYIYVDSELEKGTCFTLKIPLLESAPE